MPPAPHACLRALLSYFNLVFGHAPPGPPPCGFLPCLGLGPEIWTQQLVALGDVPLPEGQPVRPSGCNFRPRKVTF